MVQWRPSQSRSGAFLANSKVGVELIKDGIECLIPNWKATWSEAFPTLDGNLVHYRLHLIYDRAFHFQDCSVAINILANNANLF